MTNSSKSVVTQFGKSEDRSEYSQLTFIPVKHTACNSGFRLRDRSSRNRKEHSHNTTLLNQHKEAKGGIQDTFISRMIGTHKN